jgi:predicted nuclease with RNAse H fold
MKKADKQMYRRGYPGPSRFPAMEKLTVRAIEITRPIKRERLHIIEVHPASTRKALKIPTKDWEKIQTIFLHMGLKGDMEKRVLTPHEIDAITAALTGYLYLQGKTELIGNDEEGYIIVPTKGDWRRLRL